MTPPRVTLLLITLVLVLGMIGCVEMPDAAQTLRSKPVGEIHGTRTVGQTFAASHDALSRIDVQLTTYRRRNTQPLIFHLRSHPSAATDLATITFEAEEVENNSYRPFHFPPILDSEGRSFYFFFESPASEPGDAITVWHNPNDVYANGRMYIQGKPQLGDLAFKTFYTYGLGAILRDLYTGAKTSLPFVPLVVVLCVLPGYALLQLLAPDLHLDLPQRMMLSAGLTAALMPLLLLMASWVGLRLGRLMAALFFVGAGLIAFWRTDFRNWRTSIQQLDIVDISLGAIFLLALLVRLLVVRDLSVPMWVDSYHHTMISQLVVDHGGLFRSWEPYAPLRSFTYHFGFHAQVAFFHWVSGLDIIHTVIIVGQILNALSALAVFFLTTRLTGSRWAGVISALITGFISPLPMRYVNWGRYTQLSGQFILPFAIVLTQETLDRETTDYKLLALAVAAVAGLALTHYGVLFFYVCILPPMVAYQIYERRQRCGGLRKVFHRIFLIGICALVIVAPWLWNVFHGFLPHIAAAFIKAGPQADFVRTVNAIGNLFSYASKPLLVVSIFGGLLGLIARNRGVILTILWIPFLFLLSNPHVLHLPGTGVVNNFAVIISLYIPASLLSAWLTSLPLRTIQTQWPRIHFVLPILLFAIAMLGARNNFPILEPERVLVTSADEEAMAWIERNTPSAARFLVNAYFPPYYSGHGVLGSDAGLWVPLLAHRETTLPPLLYGSEVAEEPDYGLQVNDFYRRVQNAPLDSPETIRLLCDHGVTHVYLGKQGRQISPQDLVRSSHYRQVYQKDGVWIFEVEYDEI